MDENKDSCDNLTRVLKIKNKSGTESVHYPVLYEDFPEEFKQVAEKELNENEENRKQGLQRLKDFMKRENMTIFEDYVLLSILRNCKYNFKKSESKLKVFEKKRRDLINMLMKIDNHKVISIIDDYGFGILQYRDKYGKTILYTRPYGVNTEKYEIHDVGVMMTVAVLFLMKYPITSVAGYAYFGECKAPSTHIFYSIFKTMKSMMFLLFSLPVKLAKVEIFNENYLCYCFYKAVSPFLSRKICSRITLHGHGYDSLHKLYDPNILPEEFDGNMGPLNNEFYREKFLDFVTELKKENT